MQKEQDQRARQLERTWERLSDLEYLDEIVYESKYDHLDNRAITSANEMFADACDICNSLTTASESEAPAVRTRLQSVNSILDQQPIRSWRKKCMQLYDGKDAEDDLCELEISPGSLRTSARDAGKLNKGQKDKRQLWIPIKSTCCQVTAAKNLQLSCY